MKNLLPILLLVATACSCATNEVHKPSVERPLQRAVTQVLIYSENAAPPYFEDTQALVADAVLVQSWLNAEGDTIEVNSDTFGPLNNVATAWLNYVQNDQTLTPELRAARAATAAELASVFVEAQAGN